MNGPKVQRPPWSTAAMPPDVRDLIHTMAGVKKHVGVGAVCVVGAGEVEQRSRNGWALAMVVTESELRFPPPPNSYAHDPYDHGGQMRPTPNYDAKNVQPSVVEVARFVMVRGYDDELVAAKEETTRLRSTLSAREVEVHQLKQARGSVEKERDDAKEDRDEAALRAKKLADNFITERDRSRKLEEDLAKVRREIGEKEWKRITGVTK